MFSAAPQKSSAFLRYAFNVTTPASVLTLTMPCRYDDGFVAYLNGTEVARRNAPAGALSYTAVASVDRAASLAVLPESIDLTPNIGLLVSGTNVLAVNALNSSSNSGDFLIRPELVQYTVTAGALAYFTTATPGAFNTATIYNRVAPVASSLAHGFYTTAQSTTLTCGTAGATIYYTFDGSTPSATNTAAASGTSPLVVPITATKTLRAIGIKAGVDNSDILTSTYLFLSDVLTQSPTGAPPVVTNPTGASATTTTWPAGTIDVNGVRRINSQWIDYGMDPDVVNSATYSATLAADLKTIPTMSLVTDLGNLFDTGYGIFVNPGQDGNNFDGSNNNPPFNWERKASLELINPDGTTGFQVNCGIRIRGGYSRSTDNPKHAFRIFMRDEYGAGKLSYDLHKNAPFASTAVKEFVKFDLRCPQNYSWSFGGDSNGIFFRDVLARDMQLALGQPSSHGSFYHLYINGQYWGLFNIDERPEANFGASYFGGSSGDYDTVKCDPDTGYSVEATDGNLTAWQAFWTLADATLPAASTEAAKNAIYQQMKGNNANGTANAAFPIYLDEINLMDEMLVVYWGGNLDAPISNFLGNTSPNNFYTMRNRLGTAGGFKGVLHDSEHTVLPWNVGSTTSFNDPNTDRTGPWAAGSSTASGGGGFNKSNPQYIFQQLVANSTDFRTLFSDRVYKHMANNGPLTPAGATALFDARKAEIDRAVVGESARWGDSKVTTPYTRDVEWVNAVNSARGSFLPTRTAVVIAQFRNKGWYPSFDPPVWSQRGGTVTSGASITLTQPANAIVGSTIYYTTDGTDPRLLGGATSGSALVYSAAIPITTSKLIRTRLKNGTQWSALDEAAFYVTQDFSRLAITELNYNPQPSTIGGTDGDEFEFIEFKNTGTSTLDLGGLTFTTGIAYAFPAGTLLAPGQFFVLVKNAVIFATRYPSVTIGGSYTSGKLDNGGEPLAIATASGGTVLSLTYKDSPPWPVTPDGNGFTAVPTGTVYNNDNGIYWRASANVNGSPGADDPAVSIPGILVNEVLSNSALPQRDTIELYNPTAAAVNIGDWWLSDDSGMPKKYRIPANTMIAAGGYLTFDEAVFNPTPGIGTSFALNSAGDDAYLFSGNSAGNITGYSHGFAFAGGELNVSFGRTVNSVGEESFPRQISRTFGAANAGPLVGPLILSEIMYAPYLGYDEYIELRNLSASAVNLYDPANPANTWKISGIGYTFATAQSIPALGTALVVGIDPATFRTKYNISASVQIFGPYAGTLQDSGERLALEMPDAPVLNSSGATVVPYDVIDSVRYNDKLPWPVLAAGGGPSLQRLTASAYADDPANWFANGATPGAVNATNQFPTVALTSPADNSIYALPASVTLTATASDTDGTIVKVEFYDGTSKIGEDTTAPYSLVWTATGGVHSITAKAIDNSLGVTTSAARTLYASQAVTQGLRGDYVIGAENYTSLPSGTRIDPTINFTLNNNWPASTGFPGILNTNYTARWYGQVRPPTTGSYTFSINSDDGSFLFLSGALVISNGGYHGDVELFYTVTLTGGQLYTIHMDMFQGGGGATAQLSWSGPSITKQIIPQANLYPDSTPILITQPASISVEQGLPATFTVLASGIGDTYQWKKGGINIAGATAASYTIPYCLLADAGAYSVLVSNAQGFAFSSSATLTVTFTDTDGDGMQNSWEIANGFNPNSAADAALDTDGDGMTNKQEFLAGTDPRNPASRLSLAIAKPAVGSGNTLSFTTQPYKTYTLQYRDSLATGAWASMQTFPATSTSQPVTFTDTSAIPTRFYRIATP